ncbi:MAG: helix-turn-helix transcriptional regulator [Acidobacteriota bacterium]
MVLVSFADREGVSSSRTSWGGAVTTVGQRIRQLREQRRMTLEQLATLTGMSKGFLSDVENDKRGLGADSLVRVAQAAGASVDYLMRGEEAATPLTAPVVIPRELAAFAEEQGLSYTKTVELLEAHNSVIGRRRKDGSKHFSADDWRRLYEAIKDVFG